MQKNVLKLLLRITGHRCISFDGSRVYYWKVPMIVLPMKTFSLIQHNLSKKFGDGVNDILYQLGKIQGINGTNILLKKYKFNASENDMAFFLEQTNFVGIGKFEIEKVLLSKNSGGELKNINSPFANSYKNAYGVIDKSACHYIRGLVAGATQAISQKINNSDLQLDSKEISCIAKGDPYCKFIIDDTGNQSHLNPKIKEVFSKETLSMLLRKAPTNTVKTQTEFSLYLNKIKRNVFNFSKNGEVSVFDTKGLITPMDIFNLFYYSLKIQFDRKEVEKMFYDLGKVFGKDETRENIERYSFKKTPEVFRKIAGIIGIYGLGYPEILSISPKTRTLIVKVTNTPGLLFRSLMGIVNKETFDFFLSGFLAGMSEYYFNEEMKSVEYKCSAKGDSACFFKITSIK